MGEGLYNNKTSGLIIFKGGGIICCGSRLRKSAWHTLQKERNECDGSIVDEREHERDRGQ